uniref:Uncharacterized protein n=1 Tax=Nelumbo nucifera TaxID=4432 RepID=A0A822XN95_NELNU|nr:TPA_asm: hypothetical protein HUJ06_023343 [Nelumbo nucifera]
MMCFTPKNLYFLFSSNFFKV